MCNLQLYVFLEILGFLIKSSFPEHQRSLAPKNLHMFVFATFRVGIGTKTKDQRRFIFQRAWTMPQS